MRLFATSTIHAIMEQTCDAIVTKVCRHKEAYTLWEREQVIVLLSRTRDSRQVFFVTRNLRKTAQYIIEILGHKSQYSEYISHLLEQLVEQPGRSTAVPRAPTIQYLNHPYQPRDIVLPTDTSGYVYILVC